LEVSAALALVLYSPFHLQRTTWTMVRRRRTQATLSDFAIYQQVQSPSPPDHRLRPRRGSPKRKQKRKKKNLKIRKRKKFLKRKKENKKETGLRYVITTTYREKTTVSPSTHLIVSSVKV
jgi:hypothetical protein